MAQYDIVLHQNVSSSGVEFQEKTFIAEENKLIAFNSSKEPIMISGEEGLSVDSANSKIVLNINSIQSAVAVNTAQDKIIIYHSDSSSNKGLILDTLLGLAPNNMVAVDSSATADYLGATKDDGVLRTANPLSYVNGGDYITLGVQDASTTAKGVAQFAPADFSVSGGIVTLDSAVLKLVTAPSGAGSTGTANQIAIDSNYLYICVGNANWKRVSLAGW